MLFSKSIYKLFRAYCTADKSPWVLVVGGVSWVALVRGRGELFRGNCPVGGFHRGNCPRDSSRIIVQGDKEAKVQG